MTKKRTPTDQSHVEGLSRIGTDPDIETLETPAPPKGLTESDIKSIENQALTLVNQFGTVNGSKELELLDNLTNMGIQSQRAAAQNLDLLKARVSNLLAEGGPSREIANSMRDLRIALDSIDAHTTPKSGWHRVARAVPFFGRRNPVKILQKIALRYEPVSRQIATIEMRLRDGRSLLLRDNVEMRKLYEQIETAQPALQRNIYLGELLMKQLEELLQHTPDPVKRERLRGALNDVAMRVQDLRTMDEVHIQYFVSIELSRQNNNRLGQAIERTLTIATNVVTVGLAIQASLVRQRSVIEATKRTREFLGTVVTANAAAIKAHTQEIGDLYANPIIAIDKISQAHADLVESIDIVDRLRLEGITTAKENITKLAELSAVLTWRTRELLGQNEDEHETTEQTSSGNPEGGQKS